MTAMYQGKVALVTGASSDIGRELAFGVSHVGHFLLTQKLLPLLEPSAPSRVVTVSRKGHRHVGGIDFLGVRRFTGSQLTLKEYAVAKLANLLFAKELSRRYRARGITTGAVYPGVVATDVWRALPDPLAALLKRYMLSPALGC